jgi:hypothetical protein
MNRFPARPRLAVEALEDRTTPGFLAPVTSPGGGGSLAAGDFNGDRLDDIAFLGGKNTVTVSLSQGDGTFRPSASLGGASGSLYQVSLRDVNGDGNPDVVAVGASKTHLAMGFDGPVYTFVNYTNVWLGHGDGTFGAVSTSTGIGSSGNKTVPVYNARSAAADFNHDGLGDTAFFDPSTAATLDVNLASPDGGYQTLSYSVDPNAISLAVGDFNGDGRTDVIVVNQVKSGSTSVSVLFNDGSW